MLLRCGLGFSELLPDVAGEIFFRQNKCWCVQIAVWEPVNLPGQLLFQCLRILARELGEIVHIYSSKVVKAYGQRLLCRFHMGHSRFGTNGALGENICLALQLSIFVQNLQRTQQIIAVIVRKRPPVLLAVN